MLLSAALRYALIAGGLAIAAVAFLVVRIARERRRESNLPGAQVVGTRSLASVVRRWLPVVAIPLGLALAYWGYQHEYVYLIVRDGAGEPAVTRRYSSDREAEYALAPGQRPVGSDTLSLDPVWVINQSSHLVRVETFQYGRGLGFGNKPVLIPPRTSAHFSDIEHVGPNDHPPSQVTDEVNLGIAFRHWLTWGP